MKKMKKNKVRMYLKEAEELIYKAEKNNNIIKKEKLLNESKKILENIVKINKNFIEAYFTLFYVYEILYDMKVVKKEKENILLKLIKLIYNAIEIDKSNLELYKKLMYSYLVLIQIKNNDEERINLLNNMVKRINFIFEKEDEKLLDIYFAFVLFFIDNYRYIDKNLLEEFYNQTLKKLIFFSQKYSHNSIIPYYFGATFFGLSIIKDGNQKTKYLESAIKNFEKSIKLGEKREEIFALMSTTYFNLSEITKDISKKKDYLLKAKKSFEKILKFENDNYILDTYINLARTTLDLLEIEDERRIKENLIKEIKYYASEIIRLGSNQLEINFILIDILGRLLILDESSDENLIDEMLKLIEKIYPNINNDSENKNFISALKLSLLSLKESEKKEKSLEKIIELLAENESRFNKKDFDEIMADTFVELSKIKEEKKEKFLIKAIENYKNILKNEVNEVYYSKLGIALKLLSEIKEGEEKISLLKEAILNIKKAIELNDDNYKYYYFLGTILGDLAENEKSSMKEQLLNEAYINLKKAIKIKKDSKPVYTILFLVLVSLSKIKKGDEKEKIFNEAESFLNQTIEMGMNFIYEFATILSLNEEKDKAFHYLKLALKKEEIEPDFVLKDENWKRYRKDKKFKEIIKNAKNK